MHLTLLQVLEAASLRTAHRVYASLMSDGGAASLVWPSATRRALAALSQHAVHSLPVTCGK